MTDRNDTVNAPPKLTGYPSAIVKLDVRFFEDDRVLRAGTMPSLALVRLICWARRNGTYLVPQPAAESCSPGRTRVTRRAHLARLAAVGLVVVGAEGCLLVRNDELFRPWPTRRADLATAQAQSRRARIHYHQRAGILERDGHACLTCGSTEDLTIDHIVPIVRGGGDEDHNLRTLCRRCNSRKGPR